MKQWLLISFFTFHAALADGLRYGVCEGFLGSGSRSGDVGLGIQSLLVRIAGNDLSRWVEFRSYLIHGTSSQQSGEGTRALVEARLIEDFLKGHSERSELMSWIELQIREIQGISADREQVRKSTELIVGERLSFNRIQADSTLRHLPSERFMDLSSTVVTERIWLKVMDGPPSNFHGAFEGGALPVRRFTYEELKEFFRRLNSGKRLIESGISSVVEGYREGDRFRLMTTNEYRLFRYVFLNEIEENNRLNSINLARYVYFQDVAGDPISPSPVGRREPLYIQGSPFYDLLGNISQIIASHYSIDIDALTFARFGGSAYHPIHSFLRLQGKDPEVLGPMEKLTRISATSLLGNDSSLGFRVVRDRVQR